jgi:hypothetical protein
VLEHVDLADDAGVVDVNADLDLRLLVGSEGGRRILGRGSCSSLGCFVITPVGLGAGGASGGRAS